MAHVSHRLTNSFEGALAGGGDPATSPLYVFGPFLRLIVVAGVANITFGATVWLAVITVVMVSVMYRRVMTWVTDGSGGSGLCEEEFGSWAVKLNAAITFIEYTLTFLVSVAALVTFAADRIPALNCTVGGVQYRTFLAIAFSTGIGLLVNRGPKVAARAFGPATAAVLLLLWIMILASVWRFGFRLPSFDLQAFSPDHIQFTLGGYARILALMTGIEIFANLVAAFSGRREEKSRKAFGSLIIIMGTTSLTMLIVGPAIFAVSDPSDPNVSVFTQTMDKLLPPWAAYLGSFIGIAVLLSAAAASAQGLQNLSLGLRHRHYIPAVFGQRNKHDVADRPVWFEIAVVVVCFLLFGTHEETYLALYAAGVFILLSMTGWAAAKRLFRELWGDAFTTVGLISAVGIMFAAFLTSLATLIIFGERFFEGAWTYLVLVPALYYVFSFYRSKLGIPTPVEERLGSVIAEQRYLPDYGRERAGDANLERILVPLNGSILAEQALPVARYLANAFGAQVLLATVNETRNEASSDETHATVALVDCDDYLARIAEVMKAGSTPTECLTRDGEPADAIDRMAVEKHAGLIVISTSGKFEIQRLFSRSTAQRVLERAVVPVLILRPTDRWTTRYSRFTKMIVALDGSKEAESVLPLTKLLADTFDNEILLVSVPEGEESDQYSRSIQKYLDDIAALLESANTRTKVLLGGSGPARTILSHADSENADLIVLATHGRGGASRIDQLPLGSVPTRIITETKCPVLVVPIRQEPTDLSLQ